ncbi:MAG: hypothetical protein VR64_21820 [Desulfatitalea sp. BRH_c12]|nr:MAG: hypothetical protein VR64_21820 [Desulfatitalea sp. BRH_c12]
MSPHKIAQLGIARTFQVPRTFPSLTVQECIGVGARFGDNESFDPEGVDKIIDFMDPGQEHHRMAGELHPRPKQVGDGAYFDEACIREMTRQTPAYTPSS